MAERHFFSSLRFKGALMMALFSGILMLAVIIYLEQTIRQTLVRENINKGLGIAQGLAFNSEDSLLTGDDLVLFAALNNAARAPGILYALIQDQQAQVRASTDMSQIGQQHRLPKEAESVEEGAGYRVLRTSHATTGGVLNLEVPIFALAENPVRLGEIHLGLSEGLIIEQISQMRNRLALLTVMALLVGCASAYLLAGIFVRPVHALVRGVKAIGEGDLHQHIDLQRNDELGVLTTAFNEMTASLREKEFIKNTLERYVSKPLAQQILLHRDELKLGGDEKEVTILFCDLRGFTALSERLTPAETVALLNDHFTRMIAMVVKHEGMVDKLMGDSVMALFGAPLAIGDEPMRAVQCALDMQHALSELNQERLNSGLPPLAMGIGINTGPVVAGNIGSAMRMEYTVIGDSVNIASRIQGIAGAGEVLISAATMEKIRDRFKVTALQPIPLKGKSQPVGVFRVEGSQIH
jgi:adenylate cyclase